MRKGSGRAAVMLIVLGILLFACVYVASGCDLSKIGNTKYVTNTYTLTDAFQSIDIRSKETDIILEPSADGEARVVCVEREKALHAVQVEDGALTVAMHDERQWYERITLFGKPLSVTVYLPADAYDSLQIEARTGNVTVPGAFTFGSADIAASTGNIDCGASATGSLRIAVSTGDLTLHGAHAADIALSASTGRIRVNGAASEGAFLATISTGRMDLTDVTCASLTSDGSTGSISLTNVIASESIRVERSTGSVRFALCDAPAISVRTSTGSVAGTLLSGKVFTTKTTTGGVRVPDSTAGGTCEITTSTGSIDIRVE